ncbi:XAC2610-related protein [Chryseobacterium indologenes]|uniref:VCBS repeat-containing protein n=1 Tax=Chryseobacterium indologenes TaxID=253 RepID=A0A0N0ZXN5_CHRID|nr:hypothetical protein [Chryseobacterium indologenes]KPE51867.1 hypothetical protein AOB46_06475 [Chryseobacterium indologenes]
MEQTIVELIPVIEISISNEETVNRENNPELKTLHTYGLMEKLRINISWKAPFFIVILFSLFLRAQNNQQIKTDSIYPKENIVVSLTAAKSFDDKTPYYSLTVYKNKKTILKDQVYSKVGEIQFEDFNGDGIKDLLVQNISDVRSNWTYYLYLFDHKNKTFKKVMNFESVKNPVYNPKYKWVESYVVSGTNYLNLYKITGDKVKDLKYTIEDRESVNFEQEYKKAVKKLIR